MFVFTVFATAATATAATAVVDTTAADAPTRVPDVATFQALSVLPSLLSLFWLQQRLKWLPRKDIKKGGPPPARSKWGNSRENLNDGGSEPNRHRRQPCRRDAGS
jgi:hypothetical protein